MNRSIKSETHGNFPSFPPQHFAKTEVTRILEFKICRKVPLFSLERKNQGEYVCSFLLSPSRAFRASCKDESSSAGGLYGLPWAVYQESEKKLIKVSRAMTIIIPVLTTCTEQLFTM